MTEEFRPTKEQEAAIRAYVRSSIMPLVEQVIVKKLGQAMAFAAQEFELHNRKESK